MIWKHIVILNNIYIKNDVSFWLTYPLLIFLLLFSLNLYLWNLLGLLLCFHLGWWVVYLAQRHLVLR